MHVTVDGVDSQAARQTTTTVNSIHYYTSLPPSTCDSDE
jgi:hypothetical protein